MVSIFADGRHRAATGSPIRYGQMSPPPDSQPQRRTGRSLECDRGRRDHEPDADGPIPDESIVWTTDRGDLQPDGDVLATGEFGIVRLYATDCSGATHVVTLTANDGTGNVVTATGTIELMCED